MLVRLTRQSPDQLTEPLAGADELIAQRRAEADEFYQSITPPQVTDDAKSVMRQALAGMLWSKQTYFFDVDQWLRERQVHPLRAPVRRGTRNESWFHMYNQDVVSMPDKWEYPWYAAWDLAFHCIPLAMVDPDFAKGQIDLMLSQNYLHPTGQMPAYEWNFGDVNPPVHAFAALFLQNLEADLGEVDLPFMEKSFSRLLLNFTWWVNRKDPTGHNVFEGGFLGLDNIGVFDRSAALPTGGSLEQADGTAWMAMFSQNMLEMALALLERDDNYEQYVLKFVERFFWIAAATDPIGDKPDAMWDEEDGFFYDVLRLPDGSGTRLKVRSLVGLLPICATTVIEADHIEQPSADRRRRWPSFLERNQDLLSNIADPLVPGVNGRRLLSLVNEDKLRRILARMLDEERFLGPHGIRSISRLAPRRSPMCSTCTASSTGAVRAGRVDQRDVRRQLQLARAGLVPDQPAADPGADPALPVLRRQPEGRVPDRLGDDDDAVRGGRGAVPPPRVPPSCATATAGARSTAGSGCSRRTRTGGTSSSSTSTSTATTGPGSAPRTRPGGPAWWPG